MNGWREVWQGLLHLVYPPAPLCSLCEQPIRSQGGVEGSPGGSAVLCATCMLRFAFITGSICEVCGRPWTSGSLCLDCMRRKERAFLYSRSAVRYHDGMKQLVAQYKYRGDRKLGEVMAYLLWRAWCMHYRTMKVDMLTYIPLHEERLYERTFNQAEDMARLLGKMVDVPVTDLLQRKKPTGKQSRKDRTARLQSMREAFHFMEEKAVVLPERPVIIVVDDVYTTGTTLAEASCAIKKEIPVARLYGLTAAR